MQTTPKHFQGIDTVIIRVSDIERSKQWYIEKLAQTLVWEDAALKLAVLDTGGPTSLTLWQTEQKRAVDKDSASYPIFKTANAKAARQALINQGVKTDELIEDKAVCFFSFYDPDGNILEACQMIE